MIYNQRSDLDLFSVDSIPNKAQNEKRIEFEAGLMFNELSKTDLK